MTEIEENDRPVIVLGSHDWSPWVEELFTDSDARCAFLYDDASAQEDNSLQTALLNRPPAPVGFLSSHMTVLRDCRMAEKLRQAGRTTVLAPNHRQAALAWDKFEMVRFLKNTPDVVFPESYGWEEMLIALSTRGSDFIAKPRFGSTGELVAFFSSLEDARDWREKTKPDLTRFVFQRFIEGREVSVIAVSGEQGVTLFPVIDKELNKCGQWQHPIWRRRFCPSPAVSEDLERRLQAATSRICDTLAAVGMIEVEFIVTEEGNLVFLEFNPRLSATTRICSLASERTVMDVFFGVLTKSCYPGDLVVAANRHCVEFPVTAEEQNRLEYRKDLAGQLRFDTRAGRIIATLSKSTHEELMTALNRPG